MPKKTKVTKREFDRAYAKWAKAIQAPAVAASSNPDDYTKIKEYREITKLGKGALPFVVQKMKEGDFLMNAAALKLAGRKLGDIVAAEKKKPLKKRFKPLAVKKRVLGEREKSKLILRHIKEIE
jgi:hypothetical protein